MAFEITTLKKSEIDEYNRSIFESFMASESSLTKCLYPGGFTEDIQAFLREKTEHSLTDETLSLIIVRNKQTKEIMTAASWVFQASDKTLQAVLEGEEKARKDRAEQKPIPGINFEAIDDWREVQAKRMREILGGKAHVRLGALATLPAAQRKGAGAAALAWGLQKADELKLPVYLEATPAGHPLYIKFGFKDVVEAGFDNRNYGCEDYVEHWCMLRDAVDG